MAQYAWVIPALPLLSWLIITLWQKRLPDRGSYVGISFTFLAFVYALGVLWEVAHGAGAHVVLPWAVIGTISPIQINIGFQVDGLTAIMLSVVTFISFLVQLYSLGYMHGDKRYGRYYGTLSFFTFSMLGLVLADNLITLFIFFELVGVASYLLIGHYFERPSAQKAAIKAFITTRIGDVGFFIGILILWSATGTVAFDKLAALIGEGAVAPWVITLGALGILGGAVGKSAQFPLHVWLPDAMEGPTPVSALIHAATMVAAGVYLVARSYMIFYASPQALFWVALIGAVTALFAATIATVQTDMKKVLAYSTISQLGYMILGLGVGNLTAGMFHLTTHAFFKALLFLTAGSVIHGTETQEMHQMGGLIKKMPITGVTFLAGGLALAGIWPFAGFYSKDEILLTAYNSQYPIFFWMGILAAFLTAYYTTRVAFLVFFGEPRDHHRYEHAHESPWMMTVPLVILGILAVIGGKLLLTGEFFPHLILWQPAEELSPNPLVMGLALGSGLLGILVGYLVYGTKLVNRQAVIKALYPLYQLFKHKWYVDELYDWAIVRPVLWLAEAAGWVDAHGVDGVVNAVGAAGVALSSGAGAFDLAVVDGAVNGVAAGTVAVGRATRRTETGQLQAYLLTLALVVVAGLIVFQVMGG